jgi:16S rRNA (guanine966-N2)-methyltransferase
VRQNAQHIGEGNNVTLLRSDSSNPPPARFPCSLVFIDPPYGSSLMAPALKNLAARGWLKTGSVIVAEMGKKEDLPEVEGFTHIDERIYGRTKVILLEYGSATKVKE